MNWSTLQIAFSLAVLMGASLVRFLGRSRPEWSARRRLLTAASVLPAFLLAMTLLGLGWVLAVWPGNGENIRTLALTLTAGIGALLATIAFVGGLLGAWLAQLRRRW